MKVAVVGPVYPYRGGISFFTTGLARKLISAGIPVKVVSFKSQYPEWLYPGKTDKDPSIEHSDTPADYLLSPLNPLSWFRAYHAIAKYKPSFTLIQWWVSFWGPAYLVLTWLLHICGIPVVFVVHNVISHEARFYDRWLAKQVLRMGWACIPLSPKEKQRLHDLLPDMRSFLCRLPVERLSNARPSRAEARRLLNLDASEQVVLFFGIVRPYKGLKVLLDALGLLAKEGVRPTLLVVGEFWEGIEAYMSQITALGIKDQVRIDNRFVPNEETASFFCAADLFAAPYVGGTQSAVIKIAMSYGLPVVASDQIVSDLPVDFYPIHIHAAGDASDLARCINKSLNIASNVNLGFVATGAESWNELISLLEIINQEITTHQKQQ